MSSHYNIKMSLDDTLEIDYLIEDQATSGIVSVDRPDHHSNRFRTNTYVFDPQGTGEYTITVNGQELKINVTDSSSIPEDIVTFTLDSYSKNNPEKQGVYFNSDVDWMSFGATLGLSSGGVTEAYIYEKSDLSTPIAAKNISNVSGGGSFTFENVNLSANVDYVLVADDNGSSYSYDYASSDFSKTSNNGNLTMLGGYKIGGGNTGTSPPHVIAEIGNV